MTRAKRHLRTLLAAIFVLLSAAPAIAVQHVVSLNLCSDHLLVLLAPEQATALSPLAHDPALSFVAARAASIPLVRDDAESVLRLHPDVVLAGDYGARTTAALLQAEGLRVERLDMPQDFSAIRAQTRQVAALLDVPQRGEALLATMDAALASVSKPAHPIKAIAWEPRAYTAGPGTLMDAVLHAAGLINISTGRVLGREALLRAKPELLVVPQSPAFPSLATNMLDSPVLAGIPHRALPPALTICAGPFTAAAVALLAQ